MKIPMKSCTNAHLADACWQLRTMNLPSFYFTGHPDWLKRFSRFFFKSMLVQLFRRSGPFLRRRGLRTVLP
jgi:hypothetical protein